jgi:nuclear pore complex protein Nup54
VLVKCESGYDQLLNAIPQYEANLKHLFGMNFNVKVENAKQLPDGKAFLSISVVDTNTNKKLPTFQLVAFYEQPHVKQQFQNAFGNNFIEMIKPLSKQEIEEYLKVPPYGIDPLLWDKAKKENPDLKKFIPVALIGFGALNARFKSQVQETDQQKLRLGIIAENIHSLQRDLSTMRAKVEDCKRRNLNLGNRVLKTMVWQEIKRKKGYPILAEEDELRSKLEFIQSELNAPTKYKGCLNELICKLRHMQSQRQITPKFNLDEKLTKELEVHLTKEQQGIEHLLELVKKDMKDLKCIKGKLID